MGQTESTALTLFLLTSTPKRRVRRQKNKHMRKTLLLTLLLAMISNLAGAQKLENIIETDDALCMTPGALTKDGNPILYLTNEVDHFYILDDNFQVVKNITTKSEATIFYLISGEYGAIEPYDSSMVYNGSYLLKDIFGDGYQYLVMNENEDGFGVYNSDNKRIASIDFPAGYERDSYEESQAFMAIGKKLYFLVGGLTKKGSDDDEWCTAIYSIGSNPGSVALVSVAPSAKISPRAPRKGENVSVTIDSELVGKDCIVNVVSSSGQTVFETRMPESESQLDINTSRFSKGVYVVTVSAEGVNKEAAKIIIR